MYSKIPVLKLLVISVLFIVITGCAGLSGIRPLKYSGNVEYQHSVVFGTFSLERKGNQITGLWVDLENIETGTTDLFPLRTKDQFIAIPLEPSTYRIKQFYFAKGGVTPEGWVIGDYKVFSIPDVYSYLTTPFKVENSEAVYLGDFFGYTDRGPPLKGTMPIVADQFMIVNIMVYGINVDQIIIVSIIEKVEQNYQEATKKFREIYTNLFVLETKPAFPQKNE